MASIRKRGKKYEYRVTYVDDTGKQREISKGGFNTEAEAKRASKNLEADLSRNKNLLKSEMAVGDYLFDYYENKKKNFIRGRTVKNYLRNYKIANDYFGKTKMKNVTNYMYQQFLDCYGKGRAKGTVEKMHTQVRAAFKYAHANGVTVIDPTYDIYLPFENKAKDRNLMYLHEHELKKLLEVLNEDLEEYSPSLYIILLAIASGARYSELIALQFDDINLFASTININKSYDYVDSFDFNKTKTLSSERIIKIDKHTTLQLGKFLDHQRKILNNPHQLIFVSDLLTGHPISNNGANKLLKKKCREAQIKEITLHALRHTHASIMLHNKLPIEYISERLGHSDVNTTRKHYLHIIEELQNESDEKVTNIFEKMQ